MCCSLLKEKLNANVSVAKNHIYKIFFLFFVLASEVKDLSVWQKKKWFHLNSQKNVNTSIIAIQKFWHGLSAVKKKDSFVNLKFQLNISQFF